MILALLLGTGCKKTEGDKQEQYHVNIHYTHTWMVNSSTYGTVLDTTYTATFDITGEGEALTVNFPGFDGSNQKIDFTLQYGSQPTADTVYYTNDFRYSDYTYANLAMYTLSHTFTYRSTKSLSPSGGGDLWQYTIQSN